MATFKEFVDKKTREAKKQLEILEKVLAHNGMKVRSFLGEEEPYLFVKSPDTDLSFEGVRVYKIGSNIAYRVQKEASTHPYGRAYPLDVEEMYQDLLSDKMNEKHAGVEVMTAIVGEIRNFFDKSGKAEKELRDIEFAKRNDASGKVIINASGSDYSNLTPSNKVT